MPISTRGDRRLRTTPCGGLSRGRGPGTPAARRDLVASFLLRFVAALWHTTPLCFLAADAGGERARDVAGGDADGPARAQVRRGLLARARRGGADRGLADLFFSSFVLADAIAYPLGLGAVYVGVWALAEPTRRLQLAFAALAVLATFARVQYVFLPAVFVAAALVVERGLVRATWRVSASRCCCTRRRSRSHRRARAALLEPLADPACVPRPGLADRRIRPPAREGGR